MREIKDMDKTIEIIFNEWKMDLGLGYNIYALLKIRYIRSLFALQTRTECSTV